MTAGTNNAGYFWMGTAFGLVLAAGVYYLVLTSPLEAREGEKSPLPPEKLPEGESRAIEIEQVSGGESGEKEGGIPLLDGISALLMNLSTLSRSGGKYPPGAYPMETPLYLRGNSGGNVETPEYLPKTSPKLPKTSRMEKVTSLIPLETPSKPPAEFTHTVDFHSIWVNGIREELTLNQSRVVERYFGGYSNGTPELNQQTVLVELEINSKSIKEVFKRNQRAFKSLFEIGKRKGTLRLRIEKPSTV